MNGTEGSLEMPEHGGTGWQLKAPPHTLLGPGSGAVLAVGEGRDADATSPRAVLAAFCQYAISL